MNVMEYIERQRRRVIDRHAGCEAVTMGSEVFQSTARSAEEILREIDGMRGLNTRERIYAESVSVH